MNDWNPGDHPRWPAETPGGRGGEFRDEDTPGGWLAEIGNPHGLMTHAQVASYVDREDFTEHMLAGGNSAYTTLRTYSDGRRVVSTIAHVTRHYRPMLFFGILAGVLGLAGLAAGIPVALDWIQYEYIYHVPLAILATGLEILAALSLGIGLILDSVVHLERRAYERALLVDGFR